MKTAISNARVPLAKKEASEPILREIGATTTDLINAAYDFLISERRLPTAQAAAASDARQQSFRDFVARSTVSVDWSSDEEKSYKQILAEGKVADYERLA